ncbi:hypothetical protein FS935_00700 [Metabacillus litoralis]|uniref:Uncharacterized protein n=1 Tax=Metabacillus litoralis TaxID=152268 RepID=A0A5C6W8K7_9BACI|nr:hypothetical protein [Metabacillus litoralis]TXC92758.1 hypothetical protein FS935_00700 [Metabacillus litoralis]
MISIVYTGVLIVSFLFLVRKKTETEAYFPLKIVGYFILGSFAFNFNQFTLPLGLIVYLLFFRPKLNVDVKQMAAVFGVTAFILVHWILPFAINEWQSRPIIIERELDSVYTVNFQDEYDQIKEKLKIEHNHLRLEDFELNYGKNGQITDLRWQLLEQNGNNYNLYQIRYDTENNRYELRRSQLDSWLQYDRLIPAYYFFENLTILDIKDITLAKGNFSSYVIRSTGQRTYHELGNENSFFISNGDIHLIDDEKLPFEGYYILTYALKKTEEKKDDNGNIIFESFEGAESTDYLFDVNFSEE